MKKYRIVIEGERDFTEEELLQFSNENIFDVVTVLRANEEGRTIVIKVQKILIYNLKKYKCLKKKCLKNIKILNKRNTFATFKILL